MLLPGNGLNYVRRTMDGPFPFVDDTNKHYFLKLKGAGRLTCDELSTDLERIRTLKIDKK